MSNFRKYLLFPLQWEKKTFLRAKCLGTFLWQLLIVTHNNFTNENWFGMSLRTRYNYYTLLLLSMQKCKTFPLFFTTFISYCKKKIAVHSWFVFKEEGFFGWLCLSHHYFSCIESYLRNAWNSFSTTILVMKDIW